MPRHYAGVFFVAASAKGVTPARRRRIRRFLPNVRRTEGASGVKHISEFQFYLSTFEGTDVCSIDEGRMTDKSLNGVWYNQKMERVESPFNGS